MDDQNRSGNRWEPQEGTAVLPHAGDEEGTAEAADPQPDAGVPPRSSRRDWTDWRSGSRGPWVLGIAAAVLMLVMGVGGFLIGRTTAPEGFDGDGRPGFGPGQGPGQGFDRDSDDDGQGFPPQPGSGTDSAERGGDGSDGTADTTLYVVRSAG